MNRLLKFSLTGLIFGSITITQGVGFSIGKPGEVVGSRKGHLPNITDEVDQLDKLRTGNLFNSDYNRLHSSVCTVVLLSPKYVLTARHCVVNQVTSTFDQVNQLKVSLYGGHGVVDSFKFYQGFAHYESTPFQLLAEGLGSAIEYRVSSPWQLYQQIRVEQIIPFPESDAIDAVILELRESSMVALDLRKDTRSVWKLRLGNYKNIIRYNNSGSYSIENYSFSNNHAEIMGFGEPHNINLLSPEDKEKLFMNLRSVSNGHYLGLESNNKFTYFFDSSCGDHGDSGGPFYWYETGIHPQDYHYINNNQRTPYKQLLGIMSRQVKIPINNSGTEYCATIIQGFSDVDIQFMRSLIGRDGV